MFWNYEFWAFCLILSIHQSTYNSLCWKQISFNETPPEVVLMILEKLLKIDPVTLLGIVPAVCKRWRALCSRVRGTFDLRRDWYRLDLRRASDGYFPKHLKATGALKAALDHFPLTSGLETFNQDPLHLACTVGSVKTAEAVLKKFPILLKKTDNWGDTPMDKAITNNHILIVILLLNAGANVNGDDFVYSHVYNSTWYGHIEILKLLVSRGADVNCSGLAPDKKPLGLAHSRAKEAEDKFLKSCSEKDRIRFRNAVEIVNFLESAGAHL